jgi:hypothetical protein
MFAQPDGGDKRTACRRKFNLAAMGHIAHDPGAAPR